MLLARHASKYSFGADSKDISNARQSVEFTLGGFSINFFLQDLGSKLFFKSFNFLITLTSKYFSGLLLFSLNFLFINSSIDF